MTGATGFVGQNLLPFLKQLGWDVETIGRKDGILEMDQKMQNFRPDIVIHLATFFKAEHSSSDISAMIQSNLTFGTCLVDCMVRNQIFKLINTGSLWQYYKGQRDLPSCLYAATKIAFESILKFYCSAYELKTITLMLSDTFGAQDPRPKLLPKLLSIAGTEERLSLSRGEQEMEWTYITDILEAYKVACLRITQNLDCDSLVKYTVSSGESQTLKECVDIIEKTIGKKIPVDFGVKPYRNREVMRVEKLDPILPGWTPKVSFIEGIKACFHG